MRKIIEILKQSVNFFKEVFGSYARDNGNLIAAAISFYAFLSLFPILLLVIAALGYVLGSRENAQTIVLDYVREYSPAVARESGTGIRDLVGGIVSGRAGATGFGALVLLWSGLNVISQLDISINLAWGTEEQRGFIHQKVVAFLLLIAEGLLIGLSIALTAMISALRSINIEVAGSSPSEWAWLWSISGYILPLLFSTLAFSLIYYILPNAAVWVKSALLGGLFAGIFWELTKIGYSFYVTNFADFNKVYGSLGAVILLLAWINISARITILGAEVTCAYQNRRQRYMENHGL